MEKTGKGQISYPESRPVKPYCWAMEVCTPHIPQKYCFCVFPDSSSALHCIFFDSHKGRLLSSPSTYSIVNLVLLPPLQPICGYKCHRNRMCCSSVWRKETFLISRNLLSLARKVFEEWPVTHYMCRAFSTGGLPHWRPGGGIAIRMLAVQVCGKMMNCTAMRHHLSHSLLFNKQRMEYNNF